MSQYRYSGQGTVSYSEAIAFFKERQKAYGESVEAAASAVESVEAATDKPPTKERAAALAGSQITVELGFNGDVVAAYSFLHTGLDYSRFDHDSVGISGSAATWVLTQRRKNTAYQNITLKQLATKVCDAHGLLLDMEADGPRYEYFPQRGLTDYEALLSECRRIGYRVKCQGRTLTIGERTEKPAFLLAYADNLGLSFSLTHEAQGESSGGARSSDPSDRTPTGQRKVVVDPASGEMVAVNPENLIGAGETPEEFTTGSATSIAAPLTMGDTDAADSTRQSNETRIKGIKCSWSAPTTTALLTLDPDQPVMVEGVSEQIDRIWVLDSITHSLGQAGFETTATMYSPMRNKYPQPPPEAISTSGGGVSSGDVPPLNAGGFIKPSNGVLTSPFGPRGGRLHKGVDLASAAGATIWASADGVVSRRVNGCPPFSASDGCGGGYGNHIYLTHADGYETRYAHLSAVSVSEGEQVKQGQKVGEEGNSGASRGVHLHWEIRRNGTAINPATLVKV